MGPPPDLMAMNTAVGDLASGIGAPTIFPGGMRLNDACDWSR